MPLLTNAPLPTDDPPPAKKRRLHTLDDDSDDDFVGDHLRSLAPKQLGDEYEKYNPGQAGPLIDDVTILVVGRSRGYHAPYGTMGLRHSVNTGHEL